MNLFLLLATNKIRENIYCDWRSRILRFLNRSLHELHPVIILIIFFCILRTITLYGEFPQNIIL